MRFILWLVRRWGFCMENNQGHNLSIGSLSFDELKELRLEATKLIKLKQKEETQRNIDQIIKFPLENFSTPYFDD